MKLFVAVAALLVVVSGCSKPQEDKWEASLQITVTSWSGWEQEEDKPEETVYKFNIDTTKEIMVPPEDGFKFNITDIGDNGITFEAENALSPYDGSINLASDQTVFTVYRGQTLSLVTPTTDYGVIYIFELVDMHRVD